MLAGCGSGSSSGNQLDSQVTQTANPQVALYTVTLPNPGSVTIDYGKTSSYGLKTWTQSTSTGGPVSIFVAGMLADTNYHMRATVEYADGSTVNDVDHIFHTGSLPPNMQLNFQATTAAGMTPQPGLELLDSTKDGIFITDLSGNILWTYKAANIIQGVKLLPNGDILMAIGANSSDVLKGPLPPGTVVDIREVNLAGDTVRDVSLATLNAELAAASCAECDVKLADFHHDVTALPNGHWLVLANTTMHLSSTTNPPLTNEPPTTVLGDVIVDLDQYLKPVWVWNEFNHLDPNRHPFGFPDWTHTNAIIYSQDDGDLLVSIRHQSWIVKVNYDYGYGDGSILWRLGQGGDFTLQGGTDPTDWQYMQHGPSFFSQNTSGQFSLGMMDNGDDRMFPPGVTCDTTGAPPCHYSTIPVFRIDEVTKTATLSFHQILPTSLYSLWGGNTQQLGNDDVEYDLTAPASGSYIYEVTQTSSPQTVWSLYYSGGSIYRGFRIPSMYPGVQWGISANN